MKLAAPLLFLAALLAAMPAAARQVTIPQGKFVAWTPMSGTRTYRAGGIAVTVTAYRCGTGRFACESTDPEDGEVIPFVIVQARGMKRVHFIGQPMPRWRKDNNYVAIGRLARGQKPVVLFASYSQANHCCVYLQAALPGRGGFRRADLGAWEKPNDLVFPKDISGDGTADFVFTDERFRMAFGGWVISPGPPMIFNLRGTGLVDVSRRRAFRPLFERDLKGMRAFCIDPENQGYNNGGCAAYAADAAMLGRFDKAWAEILRSYTRPTGDRMRDWGWPKSCRRPDANGACAKADLIEYATYPEALRGFLTGLGYLR